MTLSTEINRLTFTGNDSTTVFSVTYPFFDEGDLTVTLVVDSTGIETVQTITTHYTVAGGDGGTGSVTMVTAPATGETLVIERSMSYIQETDYTDGGSFPADTHESALDKAVMLIQQLLDKMDRALILPITSALTGINLPIPVADAVLAWNSAADDLESVLLANIADVDTTFVSLADKDIMTYQGSTWVNKTPDATRKNLWVKGADIASANALVLGIDGNYADVTGSTTITSISDKGGTGYVQKLHFDGALTLTHHATDLILPDGANITTAAGDEAEFVNYAAGGWRYTGGTAVAGAVAATQAEQEAGSSTAVMVTPGRQQYHPSAAKGWIYWSADGTTINASHNVSSLDDNGVGDYGINWDVDFSSVNYATIAQTEDTDTGSLCNVHTITAGSVQIDMGTTGGTNADHPGFAASFGDQ